MFKLRFITFEGISSRFSFVKSMYSSIQIICNTLSLIRLFFVVSGRDFFFTKTRSFVGNGKNKLSGSIYRIDPNLFG